MIFPLDEESNIYLTREFTYATNRYSIEAAGGSIDEGESAEEAALREVRSELGVEAKSLYHIGTYHEATSRVNNVTHVFLARVKSVNEQNLQLGEDIHRFIVPLQEAIEMVRQNIIDTAVVAAALGQIKGILSSEEESSL